MKSLISVLTAETPRSVSIPLQLPESSYKELCCRSAPSGMLPNTYQGFWCTEVT